MDQQQITRTLERMPLLSHLNPTEIEQIAGITRHQRIPRFQFIYMADEKADQIYFLIKGKIKMGTFSSDGREVIREILQPEQLFGELAFSSNASRVDFAQVMQE